MEEVKNEQKAKEEKELEAIKKFMARGGNEGDVQFIDADDSFGFHCQQCGRCCMNRRDIILNPFDVFNGARYLGITCAEFMEKYTYTDIGGYSMIPMVLLDTNDQGWCPLLKFDVKDGGKFKCSIHPAKPGACANHPIGIVTSKNVTDNTTTVRFVKVDQCPNSVSDEQQVVRDWCHSHFEHEEEIALAHDLQTLAQSYFNVRHFTKLCAIIGAGPIKQGVSSHMKGMADELQESIRMLYEAFMACNIGGTYQDWDTSKPFADQAKERIEFLKDRYAGMASIYKSMKSAFEKFIGKTMEELDAAGEDVELVVGDFGKEEESDGDN